MKKPIYNSSVVPYNQLQAGQFVLSIENNALIIRARDQTGRYVLRGAVNLNPVNTVPRILPLIPSTIAVTVAKPYKVIYIDQIPVWWPIEAIEQNFYNMIDAGFNIINIAFFVNGVAADIAIVWASTDFLGATDPSTGQSYRQNILDYAHSKNTAIMISTGGATEGNWCSTDPLTYAKNVTDYAIAYQLDGVDFDLEGIAPKFIGPGAKTTQETIDWLVAVTEKTREYLGPNALISHAPQAPYLGKIGSTTSWAGPEGGYIAVLQQTSIDFLNVQYYNQGSTQYTNYNNIYINSGTSFPDSAVTDFPQEYRNLLVLGKPLKVTDAETGYNTPQEINQIMIQAKNNLGWNAGVMTWQYPYNDPDPKGYLTAWLTTVMGGF